VFQWLNGRESLSSFGDTIVYSRMPGQRCQICAFHRFPRDPVLRQPWLKVFELQETVTLLSHRIGHFTSPTKEPPSQSCNSVLVKWFWQLSFRYISWKPHKKPRNRSFLKCQSQSTFLLS